MLVGHSTDVVLVGPGPEDTLVCEESFAAAASVNLADSNSATNCLAKLGRASSPVSDEQSLHPSSWSAICLLSTGRRECVVETQKNEDKR